MSENCDSPFDVGVSIEFVLGVLHERRDRASSIVHFGGFSISSCCSSSNFVRDDSYQIAES